MVTVVCHVEAGVGDGQARRVQEPGVGAGVVVGPGGALQAGDGRDIRGPGVDHSDGVVTGVCHVEAGAGDGQARRVPEPGVGAGVVVGPGGAAKAGEGRDRRGPGVDHSDGVVKVVCHVEAGAGDGQAHGIVELSSGFGAVSGPGDALLAGDGRDHWIS